MLHVLHMHRLQKGLRHNYRIPRSRWSKASIISESSSLLLCRDHEKPHELGTDACIQWLYAYQRLNSYIKSEIKSFHAGSKQTGNQSSFFSHSSSPERPVQVFCTGCKRALPVHGLASPSVFLLYAVPSMKKVLSKQSARMI